MIALGRIRVSSLGLLRGGAHGVPEHREEDRRDTGESTDDYHRNRTPEDAFRGSGCGL